MPQVPKPVMSLNSFKPKQLGGKPGVGDFKVPDAVGKVGSGGVGAPKNLLPSKVSIVGASLGAKDGPSRPGPTAASLSQQKNEREHCRLMPAYDKYLIGICEEILSKEMMETKETIQSDQVGKSCVQLMGQQGKRVVCDSHSEKLNHYLLLLDKIRGGFDNLLEFAGEEALMEVQGIFIKKFDQLKLKGAIVHPKTKLFKANELEKIANFLRTGLFKGDISEWLLTFVDKLKRLTHQTDEANKNIVILEEANSILLETNSLLASENAHVSVQKEGEEEEEQEAKEECCV